MAATLPTLCVILCHHYEEFKNAIKINISHILVSGISVFKITKQNKFIANTII